jgi:hypothetical protein
MRARGVQAHPNGRDEVDDGGGNETRTDAIGERDLQISMIRMCIFLANLANDYRIYVSNKHETMSQNLRVNLSPIYQHMEHSEDAENRIPLESRQSQSQKVKQKTNEMSERFSCLPLLHSAKSVNPQ